MHPTPPAPLPPAAPWPVPVRRALSGQRLAAAFLPRSRNATEAGPEAGPRCSLLVSASCLCDKTSGLGSRGGGFGPRGIEYFTAQRVKPLIMRVLRVVADPIVHHRQRCVMCSQPNVTNAQPIAAMRATSDGTTSTNGKPTNVIRALSSRDSSGAVARCCSMSDLWQRAKCTA